MTTVPTIDSATATVARMARDMLASGIRSLAS